MNINVLNGIIVPIALWIPLLIQANIKNKHSNIYLGRIMGEHTKNVIGSQHNLLTS